MEQSPSSEADSRSAEVTVGFPSLQQSFPNCGYRPIIGTHTFKQFAERNSPTQWKICSVTILY